MKELKKVIKDNYEVYFSSRDGYSIHSIKSDVYYDLVELKSFMGTATTDCIAIMPALENSGYVGILNYFFGANENDAISIAADLIEDFETGKIKMQSYIDMYCLNDLVAHLIDKNIAIKVD